MARGDGQDPAGSTAKGYPRDLVLVVDGRCVGRVEVATSFRDRSKGLLGRDGLEGALLLDPAMSVHTIGMRFTIDVAYCDRCGRVIAVRQMRPRRLGTIRIRSRSVLEAEAGSFDRWGLVPGSVVTTRPAGKGVPARADGWPGERANPHAGSQGWEGDGGASGTSKNSSSG